MEVVSRAGAVVDLGAVERNCARLASELDDGVELCAVVKADGYGHGAIECAGAALAGGAGGSRSRLRSRRSRSEARSLKRRCSSSER